MTFARLWLLNILWLLPVLVFVLIIAGRKRDMALNSFADDHLLKRLCMQESRSRRVIKTIFMILAACLMILGLSGPRWGEHFQEVTRKGVDIIVCMDVSTSMLVEDIKPNRLERAKREVMDLVNVLAGDRLGLLAFAGSAYLQCPLTMDYNALYMFLDQFSPDIIPVMGTNLSEAINTAIAGFDKESNTDKVIILITDGEDNEKGGVAAAKKAAGMGIRIFVFGMGDPSGGPVPRMGESGFEQDKSGKIILSKLDEDGLRQIAQISDGVYVRSMEGDLDLDRLYFAGIRRKTTKSTLKSGKIKVYEEKFYIFLIGTLILLFWEGLLDERFFKKDLY